MSGHTCYEGYLRAVIVERDSSRAWARRWKELAKAERSRSLRIAASDAAAIGMMMRQALDLAFAAGLDGAATSTLLLSTVARLRAVAAAAEAFERGLSDHCGGPERDALRDAIEAWKKKP